MKNINLALLVLFMSLSSVEADILKNIRNMPKNIVKPIENTTKSIGKSIERHRIQKGVNKTINPREPVPSIILCPEGPPCSNDSILQRESSIYTD